MVLLFTITVFLSAGLLFSIQPMVAKTLLPIFGGGSSVWTTCMLFYQSLLLLGYLYAHVLLTRFGRRRQILIHSGVLLAALVAGVLFDTPSAPPEASTFPVPWIIGQLLLVSGLPFFAISSAGPLIQGWFARTDHHLAHDPYFLYAASNAGSLIGLLAYPLLLEPNMGVRMQRELWLIGFGLFALLALLAVTRTQREERLTPKEAKRRRKLQRRLSVGDRELEARGALVTPSPESAGHAPHRRDPITWRRRLIWVYLAFVPSTVLLGVTSYITTDVVSLPLLWVLPLALYLVTMIIAFGTRAERVERVMRRPMVLLVIGAMVLLMANQLHAEGPMVLIVLIELLLLFAVGVVCHGQLALDRPDAAHLTEFYLLMSVGGALGGVFNGVLAPLVFNTNLEYPIALVLAVAVLPWSADLREMAADKARRIRLTRRVVLPACALVYIVLMGFFGERLAGLINGVFHAPDAPRPPVDMTLVALHASVPPLLVYLAWKDGLACALTLLIPIFAIQYNALGDTETIHRARTFYGIHKVTQQQLSDPHNQRLVSVHVLHHGTTVHGIQRMDPDPELQMQPLSYYHFDGPCGMIMDTIKSMRPDGARIGIMGLGSGAIAAHGRAQDEITFFEIDPEVERIASDPELFTFLENAPANIDVRLGDGRKLIEESVRAGEPKYDIIHIDAFSSDSIPTHLLTVEAMNLYFDRLGDDGMIAFHISNRYLNLSPLVYELAMSTSGIPPIILEDMDIPESQELYRFPSLWMVVVKDPRTAIRVAERALRAAREVHPDIRDEGALEKLSMCSVYQVPEGERIRVWTDDYSNILSLIRWR